MVSRGAVVGRRRWAASARGPARRLRRSSFGAQLARLRIGKPRGAAPFALPQPGGDAADHHAADHQQQHQRYSGSARVKAGWAWIERVEGRRRLAVRHRERDDDDRERHQDQA